MKIPNTIFSTVVVGGVLALAGNAAQGAAILKPRSGASRNLQARSMEVSTLIANGFAQTRVRATYANANQSRSEADFVYAAPEGAVVTGFSYWFGEEKVRALVVEKEKARTIYAAANQPDIEAADPAIVEMIGKNLFRVRIAPLEANADLKVEMLFSSPLKSTARGQSWNFPVLDEANGRRFDHLWVRVRFQNPTLAHTSFGALPERGDLVLRRDHHRPKSDLRVLIPRQVAPLRADLATGQDSGEGFFALNLHSQSDETSEPVVQSAAAYEILQPVRLGPRDVLVLGRYRRSGLARVQWGANSANFFLPEAGSEAVTKPIKRLASSLWAAQKLAELGQAPSHRARSMAISNRFGLPGAWTSWLAMPSAERARLQDQIRARDVQNEARDLARKLILEVESGREFEPRALELRAKLRDLARSSRGRKYQIGDEAARLTATEERMNRLAISVANRRLQTKRAEVEDDSQKLRTLANWSGQSASPFVENAIRLVRKRGRERLENEVVGGAAAAWKREVLALRGVEPSGIRAKKRLDALQTRYGNDTDYRSEILSVGAKECARKLLESAVAGQENEARAARLRDEGERLARLVAGGDFQGHFYRPAIEDAVEDATQTLVSEVEFGRDDSLLALWQNERLRALYAIAPDLRSNLREQGSSEWQLLQAYNGRAREAAYRLAQTRRDDPQNTRALNELQSELNRLSARTEKEPEDWESSEWKRLKNGEALRTARQYRLQKSQGAHAQSGEILEFALNAAGGLGPREAQFVPLFERKGAPLLSVLAPDKATRVTAILPSGEKRELLWNRLTRRFEARFNQPIAARSGVSRVEFLVEFPDKIRRFALQLQIGSRFENGDTLRLELQSATPVSVVGAHVPWERFGLRKSGASFVGASRVPQLWRGQGLSARVGATDMNLGGFELEVDLD